MATKHTAKPAVKKRVHTTAKKEPTWAEIEALVDEVKSDASAKPKRKYTRKAVAPAPVSPPPVLDAPAPTAPPVEAAKPKRKYTRRTPAPAPTPILEIPAVDKAAKAAAEWSAATQNM